MNEIDKDKTIIINGSLLHTILLIFILMIVFGAFCMQMVFNYMETRDRQHMMDLQAINMVAGTVASSEQLAQMRDEIRTIFDKRKDKQATK